jgi:hypothetical protein
MLITAEEYNKLEQSKVSYTNRCKTRFYRRRYNHVNNEHIKSFYEKHLLTSKYNDKLFEIQYKNKFTLYLFIYLKSIAAPYPHQDNTTFTVSQPIAVNISEISRLAGTGRNTVKRSLKELIEIGLLLEMIPEVRKRHFELKQIMLLNDYHLKGYSKKFKRILY